MIVRTAIHSDIPSLLTLFNETVERINIRDYNVEQIKAWQNKATPARWEELFNSNLQFIVAENLQHKIIGFTSVNLRGYIHSMFIHYNYQRQGIALALMGAIEKYALVHQISLLTSDVSITARPFFEKMGFVVKMEKIVDLNGVGLVNYSMIRIL